MFFKYFSGRYLEAVKAMELNDELDRGLPNSGFSNQVVIFCRCNK